MNELAELTIKAHGGLKRWGQFETVSAHLVQGGALWALIGQAGTLDDTNVTRGHRAIERRTPPCGSFRLKVQKFEPDRVKELVESTPDLVVLVEPLLIVRRVLREQIGILHRRLLAIVRNDAVCRRLMTVPGVGPVVALTYRVTVDVPARFRNSKAVGAVFGLTPCKHQSGESDRTGGISRCGDEMMRAMLYEAAHIMLVRSAKWSWLKAWAMKIARHRGLKKAIVALARRLAVIMHRIWVDGTEFRWTREVAAA